MTTKCKLVVRIYTDCVTACESPDGVVTQSGCPIGVGRDAESAVRDFVRAAREVDSAFDLVADDAIVCQIIDLRPATRN